MTKRRGGMTAAEFLATVASDPEYQARQAHFRAENEAAAEQRRLIAMPVIDDLRSAGVHVTSVYDVQHAQSDSVAGQVPGRGVRDESFVGRVVRR